MVHFPLPCLITGEYVLEHLEARLTLHRVHTAKRTSKATTKQASMSQSARSVSLSHAFSFQVSPHGYFVDDYDDSMIPWSQVPACILQMFPIFLVFFGCGKHSNFRPGVEVRAANLQNAGEFGCENQSLYAAPAFRFSGVQMPGHFVAVDRRWVLVFPGFFMVFFGPGFFNIWNTMRRSWNIMMDPSSRRQKAVVLGIRGTTTLSDALTDAVGEATEATNHSCWMFTASWRFLNFLDRLRGRCPLLRGHLAGWKMLRSTGSQSNAGAPWIWMTEGLAFLTFIAIDDQKHWHSWLVWWVDVLFLNGNLLRFASLTYFFVYQVLEASAKAVIEKTRPALEEALKETGRWGLVMRLPSGAPVIDFQRCWVPRNLELLVFPMHPSACSFPPFLFGCGCCCFATTACTRCTGAVTLSWSQFVSVCA